MVEYIRWRLDKDIQSPVHAATKVRYQHLDPDTRAVFADGLDTLREMSGAAITQVITVDRGNDYIAESHGADGAPQVFRFIRVQRVGATVCHVAERAAACA